jgi:uncharacterized protein YbjT (DUF2867 family)
MRHMHTPSTTPSPASAATPAGQADSTTAPGKRLLILGATGAVGREVLRLALQHPQVQQVLAPTRRPLPAHPKLHNPITDFARPEEALAGGGVDAVVCALGTTIRQAGSQAAFAAVDRDLPIALGRAALRLGARSLALNSSLGASASGNFYLRTKHQAEEGLRQLGFASYTVVRPSLIDAQRSESRPGERVGLWVSRVLGPLIPRRYRPVAASAIARTLLQAALDAEPGQHTIESEHIGAAG